MRLFFNPVLEWPKRGTKIKKTLAIDPVDAEAVHVIFKLYLYCDGTSGALGVKEVVKWLDSRGYRTRRGNVWRWDHLQDPHQHDLQG
ncbi:hypothetical protein [Bradyrhizobium sp. AZCC 2289]|uniref:hypothetical protein n=1 Tax=Bradyrhizobium sp. AZCC 2289 TaxID=3117026 RepID=UPI002FF2ECC3